MKKPGIEIYTDGSCHSQQLIGAWAALVFINGKKTILKHFNCALFVSQRLRHGLQIRASREERLCWLLIANLYLSYFVFLKIHINILVFLFHVPLL